MCRRNKVALSAFGLFYLVFGVLITLQQEKIIYQPWQQDFETCEAFRDAEKVTRNGTRMYVAEGEKGVVVVYHGNAGSSCDRHFYAKQFLYAGYGYIIPEYTGYSNDGKVPTHDAIKQDVQNVVSYLQEQKAETVFVMGESIGTGMASYHTSLQDPEKLLLLSPFASLVDIAQRKFWFYPAFLMVNNAFDNTEMLRNYKGIVTMVHGDRDTIISQESGRKLFESIDSPQKEFISIDGFGHNNLFESPKAFEAVNNFLQ